MSETPTPASYFLYWGKARPQEAGSERFHLLVFHCLDVAAVGIAYLRRAPWLRESFMRALGCRDEAALENWIAFWLLIHDLGKFSEAFQGQRPDIFEELRGRKPKRTYTVRHDTLGMLFWQKVASRLAREEQWFGPATGKYEEGVRHWARAVTGHHGEPPHEEGTWSSHFDRGADRPAILEFIRHAREQILPGLGSGLPTNLQPEAFERVSQELSWWMAGLAVLADWLGSNADYFKYRDDYAKPPSLVEYWNDATARAEHALSASGALPAASTPELSFGQIFPSIPSPSPLQEWAASAPISAGPQIHLLEDVTGAGKTEAAIVLAHRIMAAGQANGFFIGLPTMATANAMYTRIARVYSKLFEGDPSYVLAHGQRTLVEQFAASVLPASGVEADPRQEDETASARCSAWLADHNKRALLAPAGVGTIDQALLAVLISKHQSLRLLGLLGKVLVVDEVHACDAYMQAVLENLLRFHARAGGSAILLSATLPQRMKHSLITAFACGCHHTTEAATERDYPLVTSWHSMEPQCCVPHPIKTREVVRRTVGVDYVSDFGNVIQRIEAALAVGKCVCWIRNTVADALDAHALLQKSLPPEKLTVFHARFALRDRLDTEQRVLTLFGSHSTPEHRRGRLVIATQVVEQSLDADWDLVITDLAPIDRLIQRAGRLQRHPRSADGHRLEDPDARDQRGEPRLVVFGPEWFEDPQADWFKSAFPKAANVYAHHGQLWLTAKALRSGQFSMPDDARSQIESVFGDEADIPEALLHNAIQAEGKTYGDRSLAQQHTVKLSTGYSRGGIEWWSEAKAPSRLGEIVVLARWEGDRLLPWCEHEELRHAWAYSTVRVAERLISRSAAPVSAARKQAMEHALETLPGKGRWCVLLPLEHGADGGTGCALRKVRGDDNREEPTWWRYEAETGLVGIRAPDE